MHPIPPVTTIDTLAGYLHRRSRSALALTAGEAATLAIAVVRGCASASSRAAPGEWRLTPEGRPVLLHGVGDDDVLAATIAVLDELVALVSADVRPGFARVRDGVLTEPPPAWAALETRLLAVVAPQPLVLGPLTPVESSLAPTQAPASPDAAATTMLDRARALARRVRPPVLLAGVGIAAVITVGAMSVAPSTNAADTSADAPGPYPASGTAPRSASASPDSADDVPSTDADDTGATPGAGTSRPATTPGVSTAPVTSPLPDSPVTATSDDLPTAVKEVLASLAACTDEACTSRHREAPLRAAEPAPLDPAVARLDVIDDFGGLAVIRLSGDDRTQYVTLVRPNDRWLVRSVRDVTDQPS